jgi:hypothetical protein
MWTNRTSQGVQAYGWLTEFRGRRYAPPYLETPAHNSTATRLAYRKPLPSCQQFLLLDCFVASLLAMTACQPTAGLRRPGRSGLHGSQRLHQPLGLGGRTQRSAAVGGRGNNAAVVPALRAGLRSLRQAVGLLIANSMPRKSIAIFRSKAQTRPLSRPKYFPEAFTAIAVRLVQTGSAQRAELGSFFQPTAGLRSFGVGAMRRLIPKLQPTTQPLRGLLNACLHA